MIKGEQVTVYRRAKTGEDPGGNPVYEDVAEVVENVLTAPGPRDDVANAARRPEGVMVSWSLHFPKTFTGSLAGARVSVRGQEPARVIGDPGSYMDALTPGMWNRPVELERADG